MDLSCTEIVWRGLTLTGSGSGSPFKVESFEGWEDLPDGRDDSVERPSAHGRYDSPVWADERVITLGGFVHGGIDRDALLQQIRTAMTWRAVPGPAEELVVTHAGRELTAFAQLVRFRASPAQAWAQGRFPFAVQWRCRDPYRYGAAVTDSTQFAQDTGGLEFDLFTDGTSTDVGYLDFGTPGTVDGLVTLTNTGSVAGFPVFTVTGPTPDGGFAIVSDGRTIQFERPVQAGSALVIDAASGTALLDGADYSRYLTRREWWSIEPGESATAFFSPLGGATSAVLTASIRPPYL